MLTITKKLRKYAVKKLGVAADATDQVIEKAVAEALQSGKMSSAKYEECVAAPSDESPKKNFQALLAKSVGAILEGYGLKPQAAAQAPAPAAPAAAASPMGWRDDLNPAPAAQKAISDLLSVTAAQAAPAASQSVDTDSHPLAKALVSAGSDGAAATGNIRVKSPLEDYSHHRKDYVYPQQTTLGTPHPLAGQAAKHEGVQLYEPSQRDLAISGSWLKYMLSTVSHPFDIPKGLKMTEHDSAIVKEVLHTGAFSGHIGGTNQDGGVEVRREKLSDVRLKALLDDATSGGIEIAPIEFDDILVTTPVLYGELYPLVNVINTSRGRRMKGGAIANPIITSGVAEGTAIQVFNTGTFVSAFDTPIFTAVGAMEVGLDFEEDSPTNVGQIITQKYGEKFMEWLDRVIAVGDGVSEPQGIFTAAGTIVVNSDLQANGPPTVGDYEALMFGVAKQFRNTKGSRNVYIGNEVSYRRCRAIQVGAGDERRVFGMTHADYTILDRPYKIQNNIPNNKIGFANLGYYRAYRRLGVTMRNETAGNYLATKNLRLIVLRARYGGQIELGGAVATSQDSQV